jgi:hypothetical protein
MKTVRVRKTKRTQPHPRLRRIVIKYDPMESLSAEEWPMEARNLALPAKKTAV